MSNAMNDSLKKTFITMDYGPSKLQNNEQSQLWINTHKDYEAYISGSLIHKLDKRIQDIPVKEWCDDFYARHLYLRRLAELFTEKKEFIANVFLDFNPFNHRNYYTRLIEELIQHIEYFSQKTILSLKNEEPSINLTFLDCFQLVPLRCISSFVIPALAKGYQGSIITSKNNMLFYIMLAELCVEAGFPKGVLDIIENNQRCMELDFHDLFPKTEVNMVIFEGSDLHSAVDCIVDAIWNMPEKAPYILDNVFVQESIYSQFCNILKHCMSINANRPIKYIVYEEMELYGQKYFGKIVNEYELIVANGSKNAYEIFQLEVPQSVMSVTVLFNHQLRTSPSYPVPIIGVDVFRNEAEVVSMCNNNNIGQVASVWTESGSTAQSVANALEVDTVWINGFDLVHPIKADLSFPLNSTYRSSKLRYLFHPPSETPEYSSFGQDMLRCWNSVETSVFSWMNCKNRQKILTDAAKNMISSGNDKFKCLGEMFSLWSAVSALSSKYVSNEFFNIKVIIQPKGIICIELDENLPFTDSVYAIIAAVAFGNCVLVSAPIHLYDDLLKWSQVCKFPKGVVNIFSHCDIDFVTPVESISIQLTTVEFVLWSFNKKEVHKMAFTKLLSKLCVFRNELDCVRIKHVQKMNIDQIVQISSRSKFVWFPNQ